MVVINTSRINSENGSPVDSARYGDLDDLAGLAQGEAGEMRMRMSADPDRLGQRDHSYSRGRPAGLAMRRKLGGGTGMVGSGAFRVRAGDAHIGILHPRQVPGDGRLDLGQLLR